ncbi:hypothetical protein OUZ56_020302 [Daphnia magna]|uniref:Uncharacterized protein n=1 Tax=Daphnia magna TaxID=35525 RepID=A0ABQ9ZE44_9CRUS|nr:hypothetical protein OUZ56_020302 [Daphnia magna]
MQFRFVGLSASKMGYIIKALLLSAAYPSWKEKTGHEEESRTDAWTDNWAGENARCWQAKPTELVDSLWLYHIMFVHCGVLVYKSTFTTEMRAIKTSLGCIQIWSPLANRSVDCIENVSNCSPLAISSANADEMG